MMNSLLSIVALVFALPAYSENLTQMPPITGDAISSFGAAVSDGKIYAVGGHTGENHFYDPETSFSNKTRVFDGKEWHELAARNFACQGFSLIAREGALYAFGGLLNGSNDPDCTSRKCVSTLDVIEQYDISENSWTVSEVKLPTSRSSQVTAVIGDRAYLIAGWSAKYQEGYSYLEKVDIYDFKKKAFEAQETLPVLPQPTRRSSGGAIYGSEVILVGGMDTKGQGLKNVTVFSPLAESGSQWRELTELPIALFAPSAGVIGSDLYVFGGADLSGTGYSDAIYKLSLAKADAQWEKLSVNLREPKIFSQVVSFLNGLVIVAGHTNNEDLPTTTVELLTQ